MRYICNCNRAEIKYLVTKWRPYTNAHSGNTRPLCVLCKLYCDNCIKEHKLYLEDCIKIPVTLNAITKEKAVYQLLIETTKYCPGYLPKTDLTRALSYTTKKQ